VAASATIISRAIDGAWILAAITAVSAAIALRFKLNPLWLLAGAAAIGWTGLGQ
jgi:chromate transporter